MPESFQCVPAWAKYGHKLTNTLTEVDQVRTNVGHTSRVQQTSGCELPSAQKGSGTKRMAAQHGSPHIALRAARQVSRACVRVVMPDSGLNAVLHEKAARVAQRLAFGPSGNRRRVALPFLPCGLSRLFLVHLAIPPCRAHMSELCLRNVCGSYARKHNIVLLAAVLGLQQVLSSTSRCLCLRLRAHAEARGRRLPEEHVFIIRGERMVGLMLQSV